MLARASSLLGRSGGARPSIARVPRCRPLEPSLQTVRHASSKRGGSSSRYMQRQKNDVFVKQRARPSKPGKQDYDEQDDIAASASGYVARSAFKLLQLDDRYKFLRPGRVIVDLGAAPGGWSQAIVERTRRKPNAGMPVFAFDLLPVVDIDGVNSIRGDFLDVAMQDKLRKMVQDATLSSQSQNVASTETEGYVDVVVSDMMANTTGNPIVDTEASLELCRAATSFAMRTLKRDHRVPQAGERKSPTWMASKSSVLVMKYFMSHEADLFRKEVLETQFHFVKAEKMEASRKESREQFWICIGFKGAHISNP
ncbi:Ribosomal RNA methyltransferase FtsJ domain protein [Kalmanozyma brasiliensis GHG001]|uniref:rRNA methyltransferase 2, mitochondrial n=1 Tax=Kalmanozyma brasiliensis (strain GHG001) TaxID=1365824 RepID=V5EMA2_KALBG|nr:Ribosomal RNA methyltransferase FtsJ domain protein [Kalmanozyma brasiliensis GHG001]EST06265.1 Ribosomal RNA methyltransferase FtsJ domain protein [Kalmanozyma brasiliensis GHG001]